MLNGGLVAYWWVSNHVWKLLGSQVVINPVRWSTSRDHLSTTWPPMHRCITWYTQSSIHPSITWWWLLGGILLCMDRVFVNWVSECGKTPSTIEQSQKFFIVPSYSPLLGKTIGHYHGSVRMSHDGEISILVFGMKITCVGTFGLLIDFESWVLGVSLGDRTDISWTFSWFHVMYYSR